MTHRKLPNQRQFFRIGDASGAWPVYSSAGARKLGGRWHSTPNDVIYASEVFSLALTEKLVHYNGVLPNEQHYVVITVPKGLSYEACTVQSLPGWDSAKNNVAREYANQWYAEQRSVVLLVPSVISSYERNVVINTKHPEFKQLTCSEELPYRWDERLLKLLS